MAKWKPACIRVPWALSNQYSPNHVRTTWLHLNTSQLLNSLCYSDSPAPICLALCSYTVALLFVCTFTVTLSSLSLLLSMLKCSGLAAAQPFTACLSFYFSESHRILPLLLRVFHILVFTL